MNMLPKIYGFNKTSEAGPDILAFSVFLGKCNFKCPYCMNSKLITPLDNMPTVDFEKIKKSIIDENPKMVTISGGEALLNNINLLSNLIAEFKNLGCKVGLSTNGSIPLNLLLIIEKLDYVSEISLTLKTRQFYRLWYLI